MFVKICCLGLFEHSENGIVSPSTIQFSRKIIICNGLWLQQFKVISYIFTEKESKINSLYKANCLIEW